MVGVTELPITVGNGLGRGARVAVAEVQGRGNGGVGEADVEAESVPGLGTRTPKGSLWVVYEWQRDREKPPLGRGPQHPGSPSAVE